MNVGQLIKILEHYDRKRPLKMVHLGYHAEGIDLYDAEVQIDDEASGLIVRMNGSGEELIYNGPDEAAWRRGRGGKFKAVRKR